MTDGRWHSRARHQRHSASAFSFSFLGTIFGLLLMMLIAPMLAKVAIAFGPFEYCALALFSLSLVVMLTGKDMIRGLMSALIGIMLSTVGLAPIDSAKRFTFGSAQMNSGVSASDGTDRPLCGQRDPCGRRGRLQAAAHGGWKLHPHQRTWIFPPGVYQSDQELFLQCRDRSGDRRFAGNWRRNSRHAFLHICEEPLQISGKIRNRCD